MKKIVLVILLAAFVVGLANIAAAASPAKIRSYIGLLESKLAVATQNKNWARANKLKAMINQQKIRLDQEVTTVTPPPPPAAYSPPAARVSKSQEQSFFGFNLPVSAALGYIGAQSMWNLRGDVLLPDPLDLGQYIGLPGSTAYRVGLGFAIGKDQDWDRLYALPINVDGIIMLPPNEDGIVRYIGGGLSYILYRTGKEAGSLGGQIYGGFMFDNLASLGVPGKSFAQVGVVVLRHAIPRKRSTIGAEIQIGHSLIL
ncbi:hypothetical protein ACFL52_04160 [Candidatus Margulisiibacteriota bacterium]